MTTQHTMRVLVDANVLISYLLTPKAAGPVVRVVEAGVLGEYTLLLPEGLLEELTGAVGGKPYLAGRITQEDLQSLEAVLVSVAEVIPGIEGPIPAITRDRSDDYLLTYAVVGAADYVVTGDHDLLALGRVEGVSIVTPAELAGFLGGEEA